MWTRTFEGSGAPSAVPCAARGATRIRASRAAAATRPLRVNHKTLGKRREILRGSRTMLTKNTNGTRRTPPRTPMYIGPRSRFSFSQKNLTGRDSMGDDGGRHARADVNRGRLRHVLHSRRHDRRVGHDRRPPIRSFAFSQLAELGRAGPAALGVGYRGRVRLISGE